MSVLENFFAGFGFRTSTPQFEVGEEITGFATGFDSKSNHLLIRIGDTILRISGEYPDLVDHSVHIRITDFDTKSNTGTAELLEVVD